MTHPAGPTHPTDAYTVPSVSITTARTGASAKANVLGMRAMQELHNVNRTRLENIFHRLFAAAQLDLTIADRFGHPVKPREWFLVPLHVIDEAVRCIRDGSIADVVYDPETARLVGTVRTE